MANGMNLPFAFIVLAVTLSGCCSAELKLDKRVVSEAIARLSKENMLGLRSNLTKQLSLQGANMSKACSVKMGKLLTTELAQAFPSNFFIFYIAIKLISLANLTFTIDGTQSVECYKRIFYISF